MATRWRWHVPGSIKWASGSPPTPNSPTDPSATVRSKVVVLLTDGENNCGLHLPEEAAGLAKKWGIRVYAISMKDDAT